MVKCRSCFIDTGVPKPDSPEGQLTENGYWSELDNTGGYGAIAGFVQGDGAGVQSKPQTLAAASTTQLNAYFPALTNPVPDYPSFNYCTAHSC